MITRMYMVILMQHDMAAAVEFYKQLGGGLQLKFQLEGAWAEFELNNGVKIGLCPTQHEQEERRPGIVLEVEDIKKCYEQYKDTASFVGEPIEKIHGIMLSLKDPGNNIIDLYQPTPEKVSDLVRDVAMHDDKNSDKNTEENA